MHIDGGMGEKIHICMVLQVHQKGRGGRDWKFTMIGHDGRWHSESMSPGELIIFEGDTIPHGRPTPLQADVYVNMNIWYWTLPDLIYVNDSNTDRIRDEF